MFLSLVVDTSPTVPADQGLLMHISCGPGSKNANHNGSLQAGVQTREVQRLMRTAALYAAQLWYESAEVGAGISQCTVLHLLHHPAASPTPL